MNSIVRFYRGTAAISREHALKAGLALYNQSSRQKSDSYVPGVFFTRGDVNSETTGAESWAVMIGQRENKTPCVIDFTITKDIFEILKGRIHSVKMDREKGRRHYEYVQIEQYEDFKTHPEQATFDLKGLTHEDLTDLRVKVGFLSEGGKFDYKPYIEWTEELGVRAITREEKMQNVEGNTYRTRK